MILKIIKIFIPLIIIAGAIASAVSVIWTIVPDCTASKECLLGYKAHCSFTPISTIILVFIAVVFSYYYIERDF